jgi:organic radical activating enzyme
MVSADYSGKSLNKFPLIVITGGEPFRQNLKELVLELESNFKVQIETNGTLEIEDSKYFKNVDIVCSPKTGKIHYSILSNADWYKYVLHHESVSKEDGLPIFALDHSASPQVYRPPFSAPVYLQPMDCQDPVINKLNQQAVLDSCLKFGYILQLQLHKIIEVA